MSEARIAEALLNASFDELPSPYVVHRLAEHVGAAGRWQELADRPYLLDTLDPDSVASAALRTAYGKSPLPPAIAASMSARHLLTPLPPADRLMTRWIAAACGRTTPEAEPHAWANIGHREPAHVVLTGHRGRVLSVTTVDTGDGVAVASAGVDATVRIWDPATGRPARNQLDTGEPLTAIAGLRTGGGRLLAGVSAGGSIQVWRWQSGERIVSLPGDRPGGDGLLAALALPDGREFLCTGAQRGPVRLWAVGDDGLTAAGALTTPSPVRLLAVLPGGILVTAGYDGAVRQWEIPGGDVARVVADYPSGGIEGIAGVEGPDGAALLLVAEEDQRLDLIGAQRATVRLPLDGPVCATVLAGLLAVGDRSGLIRLWRRAEGEWRPVEAMAGHAGAVRAMSGLSLADGRTLMVTGGADGTVRLWHPEAGPQLRPSAEGEITACAAVRLAGFGELLLTGSHRGAVQTWDARSGLAAAGPRLRDVGAVLAMVAVDLGDASVLATAGTERTVRIWNPRTGEGVADPIERHQGTIRALAVVRGAAGAPLIASGGADRMIRLWDPRTGRAAGPPLAGHRASIHTLAVVRDRLVSAAEEPVLRLWIPQGDGYAAVEADLGSDVRALAVAGEVVVAACASGEIHLSDTGGDEPAAVLRAADRDVLRALAVAGTLLAVGTTTGEVQLWSLPQRRRLRTTPLALGLRPESIVFAGARLVVRTQRGILGCEIDPRVPGVTSRPV